MSSYVVRTFLKYTVIFNENSKGDSAYLLQEGRVELSKEVNGRKKVLAVLTPVSMFGEMALILEDQRRTATAIALDDIRAVEIKKDDFHEFIRQSPQIMQSIVDVLVHRLRASTKKSMQVPSLFQGVCRTIELLSRHGVHKLDYLLTVSSLKNTFLAKEETLLDMLHKLEHLELISLDNDEDGNKCITVLEADNFSSKAARRLQNHSTGSAF